MPKLIDYPRTSYSGAWEVAEITDDTGGKCAIETAARKLNRKVSGSFKAIIGSAVKFGLLTSKRDVLTTTTLFKRIKHAYDKQEELLFHREAFLTPPLFTQLCRKFRSRELPIQMLDVILIREFGVEEINAQGVAKAFVEGCRMVGLLNEHNIIADIDALAAQRGPRREIASPTPSSNTFRNETLSHTSLINDATAPDNIEKTSESHTEGNEEFSDQEFATIPNRTPISQLGNDLNKGHDAVASLFGFVSSEPSTQATSVSSKLEHVPNEAAVSSEMQQERTNHSTTPAVAVQAQPAVTTTYTTDTGAPAYILQVQGPGVNSNLSITEEEDIAIAIALLEKIRRQLRK
jgi:hypothetical protein